MQSDSAEVARPSGYRTIFVCDIVGFGRRAGRDRIQEHLRGALYSSLENAFDRSGVRFGDCYHEDRGDGVMVIPPAAADASLLVYPLVDHLRGEVRRANELASEIATMRLRVALHCGRMNSDPNGVVGTTVNHVFRLLDAPGFKQAMEETTAAVGVLASSEFYDAVIKEGRGAIDPDEFSSIDVRVKETETTAWIRVPRARKKTTGEPALPQDPRAAGRAARVSEEDRRETPQAPDLFEVVNRILDIPLMTTVEGRDQTVGALRREIAIRVPRRPQPHLDVYSIVNACLEFEGGIEEFLAIVREYTGDSITMRALDQTIARITGRS